jgi:ATP-binding cassette subfamily A (ABC1) protein 3
MLREHKDKISKTLSGGMKRKLSLAMALVGGSKLIILDEPTSGLDVESRRQVWALIKQIKLGRSIIMSSQHLEEADELSDRICIMSHGRLLALDTAFNIKKQFGVGYNLSIEPKCDLATFVSMKGDLDNLILRLSGILGVEESSDSTNKKYIYQIPFTGQDKIPMLLQTLERQFPMVFCDLEMNSLEDAYINIAKAEEKLHNENL